MGLQALRVQLFPSTPDGRNWMARKDGSEEETDAPATDSSNQDPAQDVESGPHKNSAVEEEDREFDGTESQSLNHLNCIFCLKTVVSQMAWS